MNLPTVLATLWYFLAVQQHEVRSSRPSSLPCRSSPPARSYSKLPSPSAQAPTRPTVSDASTPPQLISLASKAPLFSPCAPTDTSVCEPTESIWERSNGTAH